MLTLKVKNFIYQKACKKKKFFNQNDIILITYADTIVEKNKKILFLY